MSARRRLFLIDGMPLLYRGHFIFMRAPRVTSRGVNVSALYGLANALLRIASEENPTHLALVFDTSEPTFRHVRYPPYKAQRDAMPEDIARGIDLTRELAAALRVPMLTCPGYEADDIIGTLAARAEPSGFDTYMVTPDKDFAQLVTARTWLYRPGKAAEPPEIMGVPDVLARWSLARVDQMVDLLGLAGDTADNIPGVPGVGEKTAVRLLQQFGDLEAVLNGTDQLKGKLRESLERFGDQARLSRELATIRRDTPIEAPLESLARAELDREALDRLLREWEFVSLGKRLLGEDFTLGRAPAKPATAKAAAPADGRQGELAFDAAPPAAEADTAEAPAPDGEVPEEPARPLKALPDVPHAYHRVEDAAARRALAERLSGCTAFCIDTETTGLDVREARLLGLAVALQPHEAYYVPVPEAADARRAALEDLRAPLENPAIAKIGHNLKFDLRVLQTHGVDLRGPLHDTMLAHYVLDPEQRHGMDHLARTFLDYSPIPITDLIGAKGRDQKTLADVAPERVAEYAAEDADVTLQLHAVLTPRATAMGAGEALTTCENPLIPVLASMEAEGIRIDSSALDEFSELLRRDVAALEASIYAEAGTAFNIASPKQLGDVLFTILKIGERPKKTRTGQYATDEEVLQRLAADHPIADLVLEYRACQKLKSTYVDTLPRAADPATGRVHTTYSQAVTATGRIQSQNPNLQNIPIRTERGREIRKAFVPRDADHVLMSADYSQIELRVMAELSGDDALRQTFLDGHDVHRATAARVHGVALDAVTPEMRRQAKMVNFGIIYGISAFGLSQRLRVSRTEAAQMIEAYFDRFPGVKRYMDRTIAFAREQGYVTTRLGRRRPLPDIHSRNATIRQGAERNAINTPIQGSAADMIKLAMIRIHTALRERGLRTRMLLQVHDELVFDLYRPETEAVRELVEVGMRTAMPMEVPIVVDMGMGANWLEAH